MQTKDYNRFYYKKLYFKLPDMNITVNKIKKELELNYGWSNMEINSDANCNMCNELIKDTLKIINKILIEHKGISIKNKN